MLEDNESGIVVDGRMEENEDMKILEENMEKMKWIGLDLKEICKKWKEKIMRNDEEGEKKSSIMGMVEIKEGEVDIDDVERKESEIGKRRIKGEEIIKRKEDENGIEEGKKIGGMLRVLNEKGLCELKIKDERIEMNERKKRKEIVDEVLKDELSGGEIERKEEVEFGELIMKGKKVLRRKMNGKKEEM